MAKKTRKHSRKSRKTRRRYPKKGGSLPLAPDAAIKVSTAGDVSNDLLVYR